jgi:hypothetical protein
VQDLELRAGQLGNKATRQPIKPMLHRGLAGCAKNNGIPQALHVPSTLSWLLLPQFIPQRESIMDSAYTYAALSAYSGVPRSTLSHRARGRASKEDKAKSQQYLTPIEERALVQHLMKEADSGYPVALKHVPALAFIIARRRSTTNKVIKPPGKGWT